MHGKRVSIQAKRLLMKAKCVSAQTSDLANGSRVLAQVKIVWLMFKYTDTAAASPETPPVFFRF